MINMWVSLYDEQQVFCYKYSSYDKQHVSIAINALLMINNKCV